MFVCPKCDQQFAAPLGLPIHVGVRGPLQEFIGLYCPHCRCFLGAVKP